MLLPCEALSGSCADGYRAVTLSVGADVIIIALKASVSVLVFISTLPVCVRAHVYMPHERGGQGSSKEPVLAFSAGCQAWWQCLHQQPSTRPHVGLELGFKSESLNMVCNRRNCLCRTHLDHSVFVLGAYGEA